MCITEKGKKYVSLMEELKNKILSGEIRPGEKLPSENELAQEYGISRHTVRKALAILANDGYITTEHGKGTFCSDRMAHRKNSKNIAVITTYISDYIFPRLIQGMDRVTDGAGVQYHTEKYWKQPAERSPVSRRYLEQRCGRTDHRAEQKSDFVQKYAPVRTT